MLLESAAALVLTAQPGELRKKKERERRRRRSQGKKDISSLLSLLRSQK
jgi:hypothetical protein